MDSDEGVREAVSWLRRAHPLSHTTTQRKSQVHHALAEMMSNVSAGQEMVISSDIRHTKGAVCCLLLEVFYLFCCGHTTRVLHWQRWCQA
eukprot:scaffold165444_cov19-Tisochrysis_lutea.AAC.2